MMMFLKGLTRSIMEDVIRDPRPDNYNAMKTKAINATKSRQLIDSIAGRRPNNFGPNFRGVFNTPRPNNFQNRPRPGQFTSSNAPRSFANVPVPMDIDDIGRAQTRRNQFNQKGGRGRGRGQWTGYQNRFQSNTVTTTSNNSNACFECGEIGHYARNCPRRRRNAYQTNKSNVRAVTTEESLIDWDDGVGNDTQTLPSAEQDISALSAEINSLSAKGKEELIATLTGAQDFQSA